MEWGSSGVMMSNQNQSKRPQQPNASAVRILIHACCAHCLAKTLSGLRAEYGAKLEPVVFWFNPNIHPLIEYRRRLKAVRIYLERDPIPFVLRDEYGLIPFCSAIHGYYDRPARCAICYALRLNVAAEQAAHEECKAFTSTLITSVHQDHEQISAAGNKAAERHGVPFLYRDLRAVAVEEEELRGIYRQQYCGCVFSEFDRWSITRKHLYRENGGIEDES